MSWPTQWSEQTPSIYHQHCCSKCLPPSAAVVDFAPFIKPRTRAAALMQSSELDGEITCEDSPGKKNTEFHRFTASFMTQDKCCQKKNHSQQAIQWVQRLFMAAGAHLGFHLTGVDPALLSIPRLTCPPPSSFTPAENLKLLQAGDVWILCLATAI